MRPIAIVLLLASTLSLASPPAAASTWTVTADSTMDGNAGSLLYISEEGFPGVTYFTFEEDGKARAYAARPDGGAWQVFTQPQYLVPVSSISAGMTWRFPGDDDSDDRQAEAITLESVSNNAGDFLAWRVDVARPTDPAGKYTSYWFAPGVGLVASVDYEGFTPLWESSLESYSVTGSGYFPTEVGNTWTYLEISVPNEPSSVGKVKSRYGN